MKVSPVQLKHYVLSRVAIQPRDEVTLNFVKNSEDEIQDWRGVLLNSGIEFGWADGQGDDLRTFALRLRLQIPNEMGTTKSYNVDLESIGYFELIGDLPIEEREDIAKVNGASLLYGVLREVLFSLTARFPRGPMLLPSVNFFDLKQQGRKQGTTTDKRTEAEIKS